MFISDNGSMNKYATLNDKDTALGGTTGLTKVSHYPASQELADYIRTLCPVDAHMNVVMHGVWIDNDDFRGQFMSSTTTTNRVIRAFSCKGMTYWTLEVWHHDNGYRCTLSLLTKAEFLSLIR